MISGGGGCQVQVHLNLLYKRNAGLWGRVEGWVRMGVVNWKLEKHGKKQRSRARKRVQTVIYIEGGKMQTAMGFLFDDVLCSNLMTMLLLCFHASRVSMPF